MSGFSLNASSKEFVPLEKCAMPAVSKSNDVGVNEQGNSEPDVAKKGRNKFKNKNAEVNGASTTDKRRNRKSKCEVVAVENKMNDKIAIDSEKEIASSSNSSNLEKKKRNRKPKINVVSSIQFESKIDSTLNASLPVAISKNTGSTAEKKRIRTRKTAKKFDRESVSELVSVVSKDKNLYDVLVAGLSRGTYQCCICHDAVKQNAQIWSCSTCFLCMHLSCAIKWSVQCVGSLPSNKKEYEWRCPVCASTYQSEPNYKCFCGQIVDPILTPAIIPHSCGELCQKPLGKDGCKHLCNLLCHPGPCNPCTAILPGTICLCGKNAVSIKCGDVPLCNSICNKPKLCLQSGHVCRRSCHDGECGPCDMSEIQDCFCGSTNSERPCGSGVLRISNGKRHFSCAKICSKNLSCGNHKCVKLCHAGSCSICPRAINSDEENGAFLEKCSCGSTYIPVKIPRESCLDLLPTCSNVCGKTLTCGSHTCPLKCHDSPCQPCSSKIVVHCRCGNKSIHKDCIDSIKSYECEKICSKKLSCGIHKCRVKCCPEFSLENSHFCGRVCDKLLSCGLHNCPDFCHLGHCASCKVILREGVSCPCGHMRIPGPVICGTKAPDCKQPCKVKRPCGHACLYTCHTGPCPPCVVLVDKKCETHGVELKHKPCKLLNVTCGQVCDKLLSCKEHSCLRACHMGDCQISSSGSSKHCAQNCKRYKICGHACNSLCHVGENCPDTKCIFPVSISCKCRLLNTQVACGDFAGYIDGLLPCEDSCYVEERNRNFREAFQINPLRQKRLQYIPYSRLLLNSAISQMEFVLNIEKKFAALLREPTFGKIDTSPTSIYFPELTRQRQWLVHQMSLFYFVEVQVLDSKSTRVVKNIMPHILLSNAAQIFSKQPSTVATAELYPPNCSLVFYNFSFSMKFYMLQDFLLPWAGQYTLCRVDFNDGELSTLSSLSPSLLATVEALVVFNSSDLASEAAMKIVSRDQFVCSIASDLLKDDSCTDVPEKAFSDEIPVCSGDSWDVEDNANMDHKEATEESKLFENTARKRLAEISEAKGGWRQRLLESKEVSLNQNAALVKEPSLVTPNRFDLLKEDK